MITVLFRKSNYHEKNKSVEIEMYIRKSSLKHVVDSYSCLFYSQSRWQGFFYTSESESSVDRDVRSER